MVEIYIYSSVFFIFGLIMGSFYNVVGYRLPQGMSILKPSSHCPKCKKKLTIWELIPVFSYLWQNGKCTKCKTKISLFYPVIEALTGILFVICYLIFGLSMEVLVAMIFVSVLLVSTISDLKYMIIPDEILLLGGIMLFITRLTMEYRFINLILMAIIPFIVLYLIKLLGDFLFKKESLGGADIKLMVIFGLVLGWESTILTIFLASFIALPISLIVLNKYKTNVIPFGPFLSIAALITYFQQIDVTLLIDLLIGK
ncbi:MAG: prepilin peptidase [Bacilli bacterium]|jgi:leader peptidase (prepilin peptidase)/N-methyltransferase|nr:prepilin peptidase [Bacilli bacterium]